MTIFRSKPPVRHVPKDATRHRPLIITGIVLFVLVDIALIASAVTAL
jgi:hypothetical protein